MTWVMGQPIMFGYAICLADIQVTFGTKTEDCLQKIYKIDRNLVVGFAGSVNIGFAMLNGLAKLRDSVIKENLVFEPDKLAEIWSEKAREIFNSAPEKYKTKGSELLMAGVSYSRDLGIPGFGKPVVVALRYPYFKPELTQMGEWLSIGKGREVKHYQKILKNLESKEYNEAMQMETAFPGGYGSVLGFTVGDKVRRAPKVSGISKHLHISVINRQGVKLGNTDHWEVGPSDTWETRKEFRMPKVATSWKEFQAFCREHGYNSAIAAA